jgi:hypothetical protein
MYVHSNTESICMSCLYVRLQQHACLYVCLQHLYFFHLYMYSVYTYSGSSPPVSMRGPVSAPVEDACKYTYANEMSETSECGHRSMYVYEYMHRSMNVHIFMYVYVYVYVYVFMHLCMCMCTYHGMHIDLCVYVYSIYVYMYVSMRACACMRTYHDMYIS